MIKWDIAFFYVLYFFSQLKQHKQVTEMLLKCKWTHTLYAALNLRLCSTKVLFDLHSFFWNSRLQIQFHHVHTAFIQQFCCFKKCILALFFWVVYFFV